MMLTTRRRRVGRLRSAGGDDKRHLREFAASRAGLEAYLEPRTSVTEVSLVLVAGDGEWTRRRVPSGAWATSFARRRRMPVYDVTLVGYPQRMRDYRR